MDFFLARVSTSSTALIAITVRTRVLTNARLVSKVLDAICDNLGRIKSLDLNFDSFPTSTHHSVTRALSNPAPSLQHLALRSSSSTVVLPRRLFGCELPQLQKLTLIGFDTQTSYPLAFERVIELVYTPATPTTLTAQRNFAQALRRHRDLNTLTLLSSPSFAFLTTALPSLATLSTLHLAVVGHGLLKWLDNLQHLHTISVSMLSGCPVTDDAFFRHLKGDLSIAVPRSGWNNVARTVRIEVTETGPSKRSRCVTREPIETLFDAPLRDNSVITKVIAATIPFGLLLPIGRWFDSNALSLRQMRVVIGNGVDEYSDAYEPVHAFLNCPKLEILEVISGSPSRTHLSQKDLDYLASKVLRARFAALEIVLENVTIGGSDRYSDHSHSCQLWDSSECTCCDGGWLPVLQKGFTAITAQISRSSLVLAVAIGRR